MRETERSHLLIHLPPIVETGSGGSQELGTQFMWMARTHVLESSPAACQVGTNRKLELTEELGLKLRYYNMECKHLKQHFN